MILGDTVQVKSSGVLDYCYHTSKASSYLSARSGHQGKAQCINEEEIRSKKRTSLSTENYQRASVVLLRKVLGDQHCC